MALPMGWSGFAILDHASCDVAWPGSSDADNKRAAELLKQLGSDKHLKTILTARKWRVEVLRELNSREAKSHCGHNAGMGAKEIAIQLRKGGRFFEYDQCLKIMMHELSHNEHSNHGAQFKALEVDLWRQYNALAHPFVDVGSGRRVGGTGRRLIPLGATYTAFGGAGHRLGGGAPDPSVPEPSSTGPSHQRGKRKRADRPANVAKEDSRTDEWTQDISHRANEGTQKEEGAQREGIKMLFEMFPTKSRDAVCSAFDSSQGDITVAAAMLVSTHDDSDTPNRQAQDVRSTVLALAAETGGGTTLTSAVGTLLRCLTNIIQAPHKEKYRTIRINNPKFAATVGMHASSRAFLTAVGFVIQAYPNSDPNYNSS